MLRIALFSAALLAATGVAQAAEQRVALHGKTEAQIRADVAQAAKVACQDVSVLDYAPCVQESTQKAMSDVARLKASKVAALTF